MARLPRFIVPGQPQHVILRGNNRTAIFSEEADYQFYLDKLQLACKKHGCDVHAYVLMTNHVHLLITPHQEQSLGKTLQMLGRYYVQYYNYRYQRTGTLWEGRYKAKPMLFGALLDAIAGTLQNLPNIRLDRLPRIADFARIACAYAEFTGLGSKEMLRIIMQHMSRQRLGPHCRGSESVSQNRSLASDFYCSYAGSFRRIHCKGEIGDDPVLRLFCARPEINEMRFNSKFSRSIYKLGTRYFTWLNQI